MKRGRYSRPEKYLGENILDFIIDCKSVSLKEVLLVYPLCPSWTTRLLVETFAELQSMEKKDNKICLD